MLFQGSVSFTVYRYHEHSETLTDHVDDPVGREVVRPAVRTRTRGSGSTGSHVHFLLTHFMFKSIELDEEEEHSPYGCGLPGIYQCLYDSTSPRKRERYYV